MEEPRNGQRKALLERFRDGAPAYVSIPVGVLFIIGGILGFLPVLGFWMLPLGLAILAPNVPFAKRLLLRVIRLSLKYKLIRRRKGKS